MKAYITVLSTNEYLDGVLALNQSLKDVGSKYPLVVAITNNIHPFAREILSSIKVEMIELEEFSFSEKCKKKMRSHGAPHWAHTAAKLQVFGLTQFEKIIYLDSDMLVLKNIDHLFDCPHMTAAIDSPMISEENKEKHSHLNSGLMVIEPAAEIESQLKQLSTEHLLPDQDLIRLLYPDWITHKELQLPVIYNFFAAYWKQYYQSFVPIKDIYVLHFIGKEKPFHKNITKNSIQTYYDYFEGLYFSALSRSLESLPSNS
jgi:alpha-N-acetylglucosamine transferase